MALDPLKIDIEVNKANFEKQLKGAEQFARDNKKKIDQVLKVQLDFNIASFQTKLAEVKRQLKTATGNQKINLQIEANQLQRGLTEAKRNLNNLVNTGDTGVSRLQAKFSGLKDTIVNARMKIGLVVGGAIAIFNGIKNVLNGFIQAAQESERALAQLNASLQSTGKSAYISTTQIQEMAVSVAELNSIDDDTYIAMSALALRFQNITADVLPQFLQAVTDVATAQNGGLIPSTEQLTSTTEQLAKSLNNPESALKKLKKAGVEFTKTEGDAIVTALKHNNVALAQKLILDKLTQVYGGSMKAALTTLDGKQAELNRRRGETKETIGGILIPFLSQTLTYILKVGEGISRLVGQLKNMATILVASILPIINKIFGTSLTTNINTRGGIGSKGKGTAPGKTVPNLEELFGTKLGSGGGGGGKSKSQQIADDLKANFKSAFDSINSDIDKSKGKIQDYQQTIKDLTKDLEDLNKERDADIASRVAEIDSLLAKVGEDTVSSEEKIALENERAEAFAGLNAEQTKLLEAQIQQQKDYNALSDIGKIKADFEVKKKSIDEEIALKQNQLAMEEEAYKKLKEAKLLLEQDYTAQFKGMIEEQKTAVDGLINKYLELFKIKDLAGVGGSATTTTTTTTNKTNNNTFNVSNITLAEYLSRSLSK